MRNPLGLLSCLLFSVATLLPAHAAAQTFSSSAPDTTQALELDFRLGGIWPEDATNSRPSFGGRVGLYLWGGERTGRLSAQGTVDYRSLGDSPAFIEGVTDLLRQTRATFAMGASLGYDVVRTSSLTVEVRGGVMLERRGTSLQVRTRAGSDLGDDVWEPICHFQGFSEECSTDYSTSPTLAVGLRRYFGSFRDYFVGVEYTRVLNNRNILVGSVGVRLD